MSAIFLDKNRLAEFYQQDDFIGQYPSVLGGFE